MSNLPKLLSEFDSIFQISKKFCKIWWIFSYNRVYDFIINNNGNYNNNNLKKCSYGLYLINFCTGNNSKNLEKNNIHFSSKLFDTNPCKSLRRVPFEAQRWRHLPFVLKPHCRYVQKFSTFSNRSTLHTRKKRAIYFINLRFAQL